jgi:flagellar basal body-associated protein FliL
MAEEDGGGGGAPEAPSESKKPVNGALILVLVNTLAIVGALGTFVYTKILFKRPSITESSERKRLINNRDTLVKPAAEAGRFVVKPVVVNLQPTPLPRSLDGRPRPNQKIGKQHYATVGMEIKLRDKKIEELLESVRPVFQDELIQLLSRKQVHQLNNVQGRYLLRTEIIDLVNQLTRGAHVRNVFFTEFTVL